MLSIFSKRLFFAICLFLMPFLNSCYSHFMLKESALSETVNKNKISKIQLKNGTEFDLVKKENVLITIDSDSLTIKNVKGEILKIAQKDVVQWYEYKFNFIRTLIGTTFISVSILGMAIGTCILFIPIRGN
jgi:hypothetical protein